MRKVELLTADGVYVATVEIAPYPDSGMPRVVRWGERTFLGGQSFPQEKPWEYREAFVSVSFTKSPGLERWQPAPPKPVPPVDHSQREVVGVAVAPGVADTTIGADGQQAGYVILSAAERAKGFVRPVRRSYVHVKCGASTKMSQEIAESYARAPDMYSGTFCVSCKDHFPVGEDGEFTWDDGSKVGT